MTERTPIHTIARHPVQETVNTHLDVKQDYDELEKDVAGFSLFTTRDDNRSRTTSRLRTIVKGSENQDQILYTHDLRTLAAAITEHCDFLEKTEGRPITPDDYEQTRS